MHIMAKVAIGAGLVAGAGLVLTACGKKDPSEVPNDLFRDFDKNGDGLGKAEATRDMERTSTNRTYGLHIGDFQQYTDTVKKTTWTESALRAVHGADKNDDALASWAELTDLAKTFDKDGDGALKRSERNAFEDQYGVQVLDERVEILGQSSGLEYRPHVDVHYDPHVDPHYDPYGF